MAQAGNTPLTLSNPSSIASKDDIIYDDLESSDYGELDGTDFDELSEFLSDDSLRELTGCDDLNNCLFLEARVNSEEVIIRNLGEKLPRLIELKLNNSNINSIRDLGTAFKKLMVLWMSRCNLQELDGISAFDSIKELYLAFNEISDLSPLVGCDTIEVLDLEGNAVTDISEVQFLVSCSNLSSLTLEGNPVSKLPEYHKQILEALPFLLTLDDQDTKLLLVNNEKERSPNGGELFALNTSMDEDNDFLDSLPSDLKQLESDKEKPGLENLRISYNPDNIEELLLSVNGNELRLCLDPQRQALYARKVNELEAVDPLLRSPWETCRLGGFRRTTTQWYDLSYCSLWRLKDAIDFRPSTANMFTKNMRPGSSKSLARPMSAYSRFTNYQSNTNRPGTGSRPTSAGGRRQGQPWAQGFKASEEEAEEDVSSDLTFGTDEVYCGNLARGLRRRNVAKAVEKYSNYDESQAKAQERMSSDEILEELRKWKAETVSLALSCADDWEEPQEIIPGTSMGTGQNSDVLVLEDSGKNSSADEEDSEELFNMESDMWNFRSPLVSEHDVSTSDIESMASTARCDVRQQEDTKHSIEPVKSGSVRTRDDLSSSAAENIRQNADRTISQGLATTEMSKSRCSPAKDADLPSNIIPTPPKDQNRTGTGRRSLRGLALQRLSD
ncbi:hypothetical protein GUITHDRAFT_165792 [Guillardia theta CCMP2712]|uniref:U2A'/phosphoprotein 32 family A C-terminal domain-containing protein n=1 Tax=Guillardia theta (strain CCMP2712) TaxID=905079 RepID=L1IJA6_GUITC|nr:hypothetical protein GUITHDRAFT_165792 [Guillardia theta CCMP2712]EKX36323.1 hypothetical protein GUITHDRAFT_165792 [Guillardia theta CCMP2712]|eukprot:XP_005823303.1 hypothetical protein GUITHDRAFT_165792 [Guillardia theta CCMP2712]